MDFGKRLKEQLKWQGIRQTELAKQLEIGKTAVSNWITGRNYPTVAQLIKICKILDTTPNELLDFNSG